MQQLYCLLFVCLLLALEIRAIDDGMRAGRKLQTRHEMPEMAEEGEAEAPSSSIAIENTGQPTDQALNCSKELENNPKDANSTTASGSLCEQGKSEPPPRQPFDAQECQVTHNRKFKVPRGQLIAVVHTPSARICCELCRSIKECYSWWRRYTDGHCHINRVFTRGVYSSNAAGGYL